MYRNLTSDYSFTYEFDIDLDEVFSAVGTANVDYDICAADRSVGELGGPCDFRITEIDAVIIHDGEEVSVKLTDTDKVFHTIVAQIYENACDAAYADWEDNR